MKKTIIVLTLLFGDILPMFSEKLPSEVFKESRMSGGESKMFKEVKPFSENKKSNDFFMNEEKILRSGEPDPEDGEGHGQGEGGFVGSRPVSISGDWNHILYLLLMTVAYYIFKYIIKTKE